MGLEEPALRIATNVVAMMELGHLACMSPLGDEPTHEVELEGHVISTLWAVECCLEPKGPIKARHVCDLVTSVDGECLRAVLGLVRWAVLSHQQPEDLPVAVLDGPWAFLE